MHQKNRDLGDLMGITMQVSMSDQLFQRISKLILEGKLEEGYVFPNEAELCEQLKLGRSTLREAYKALELSGYITRTKRGTTVNSRIEILRSTALKTIFSTATPQEFSQFRRMIESESASCAASHAGVEDVQILETLCTHMEEVRSSGDFEALMEADERFHTGIAELSGNSLIAAIVEVMADEWKNGIQRNFKAAIKNNLKVFDLMLQQHRGIVEAIKNCNGKLASARMKDHLESVTAIE